MDGISNPLTHYINALKIILQRYVTSCPHLIDASTPHFDCDQSPSLVLNKRLEMYSDREYKRVKTRSTFGQKTRDFLRIFFERSNIHGFFYFSLRILRVVEKFVYAAKVDCATLHQ